MGTGTGGVGEIQVVYGLEVVMADRETYQVSMVEVEKMEVSLKDVKKYQVVMEDD